MAYDKTNSFALFRNARKTEEKHPDYTGTFTDDQGREYFADAWLKKDKAGKTYMSGKMKLKNKQGGGQQRPANNQPDADFIP